MKGTNQRLVLFLAKYNRQKRNLCTDEKRKLIKDIITLHAMLLNLNKECIINWSMIHIQYPLILILYENEELMMKLLVEMVMMKFDHDVVVDKQVFDLVH